METTIETTESPLLATETTEAGLTPPQTPAPSVLTGKRANWTIAHKIDGSVITWSVKGAGTLTLDLAKVHEANRTRAMAHGMVQRVSDAAAMARDAKTGASATAGEKFESMKRLVEHYVSGAEGWSPVRNAQGNVGRVNPQARLLIEALKIYSPTKPEEVIEKFVKELTGAQLSALLVSEALAEAMELAREQLREKEKEMAQGVDAQELLKGL